MTVRSVRTRLESEFGYDFVSEPARLEHLKQEIHAALMTTKSEGTKNEKEEEPVQDRRRQARTTESDVRRSEPIRTLKRELIGLYRVEAAISFRCRMRWRV
jgi:hypothetical protein